MKTFIPHYDLDYVKPLVKSYLLDEPQVSKLHIGNPNPESIIQRAKTRNFSNEDRQILYNFLKKQYQGIPCNEKVNQNIESLKDKKTFTITTGHQLCLFTGPLYFIYKILDVINISEKLNELKSDFHFVPVYWMASEDHDFEEINHFRFKDQLIEWNSKTIRGAVGGIDTESLRPIFEKLKQHFGTSKNGQELLHLFESTYLSYPTLSSATRALVHNLFSDYGLVCFDGNELGFKKKFLPYALDEIKEQKTKENVQNTIDKHFKRKDKPVSPRPINLFYLEKNKRERIDFIGQNSFELSESKRKFTEAELIKDLEKNPEKISPNVLLRPLFQEIVLPNLAYIGGGSEISYWLQLKQNFESFKVDFPFLVLRNSVLLLSKKQESKLEKLNLDFLLLHQGEEEIIRFLVKNRTDLDFDFENFKAQIRTNISQLKLFTEKTEYPLKHTVLGEQMKMLRSVEKLEKKLFQAEKRKYKSEFGRAQKLFFEIFPKGNLQERKLNFSTFYLEYGKEIIGEIKSQIEPIGNNFNHISLG